jgi:DNA-binding transcriptional LysR family regulator
MSEARLSSDRLRSFITFAEDLNFTRAASRLNVSQRALHVTDPQARR